MSERDCKVPFPVALKHRNGGIQYNVGDCWNKYVGFRTQDHNS